MRVDRLVGILIIAAALLGGALVSLAVFAIDGDTDDNVVSVALFGFWRVAYDAAPPGFATLVASVGIALLLAAGVAALEHRIATRSRRAFDADRQPLGPRVVMAETRGAYAGPVRVTALIPAHNEEGTLPTTLASLAAQRRRPDHIIVVADNCTDRTVELAREAGVEVIETVGNRHKKAGALNQALRTLLPDMRDNDTVLVMDADTSIDPAFIETAVRYMTNDRALMAVGGLFSGEEGHGILGQFQRNEFTRYSREIRRRRGRLHVLTGTASVFRARALRTIARERGRAIPGEQGLVYDVAALTEDNEITLALKSLGGLTRSPAECTVVTEIMPTWTALWHQRLRWQRGALENLGAYGFRSAVMRYWMQQLGLGYAVLAISAYVLVLGSQALAADRWVWFPFWVCIGLVFVLERVVSVWRGGWRARVLAALLLPELIYDVYLNAIFVRGVLDIAFGRRAKWTHLQRAAMPAKEA